MKANIVLWNPPPSRTSFVITAWDDEDGDSEKVIGPELTDEEVFCDLCGATVPLRPVPLAWGTHALCPECLIEVEEWWRNISPTVLLAWHYQILDFYGASE
jgi:hypothetical protein